MGIRNSAKAILVHEGKMLVNKNLTSLGEIFYGLPIGAIYYELPGGGQNQYETIEEAVKRECLEETGYSVEVIRLAALYEEISINEGYRARFEQYAHRYHFVFLCRLTDETVRPASEKDFDMLESVWVDLEEVKELPLYPRAVREKLDAILQTDAAAGTLLYLGSERVP